MNNTTTAREEPPSLADKKRGVRVMSDIAKSMEQKGYIPLSTDDKAGIGFRPSLHKSNRRLGRAVWFDTGLRMKDGTPRMVCAYDEAQLQEYLNKGWRPLEADRKKKGKGDKK